jgi:transposase-like protein
LPRPKKSFSPEFKDEAVKMVIETSRPGNWSGQVPVIGA